MTDETPQPEGEPEAAAPEASPTEVTQPITPSRDEDDVVEPTQANPVAVAAAAASPGSTTAPAAAPPASADRPAGFFVPKWVGIVAAAVIAALVFGAVGYTIGDSSSDSDSSNSSSRVFPGGATNGNGPFANGGLPNGLPGNSGNGNGGSSGSGSGTSGNGSGSGSTQTPNNGGFLGVAVQTGTNGVTISSVQNGSPAATAGLQQGDIVNAIDGRTITTAEVLGAAIRAHSSGDQITITYTRDGKSGTAKVTLGSRSSTQSN